MLLGEVDRAILLVVSLLVKKQKPTCVCAHTCPGAHSLIYLSFFSQCYLPFGSMNKEKWFEKSQRKSRTGTHRHCTGKDRCWNDACRNSQQNWKKQVPYLSSSLLASQYPLAESDMETSRTGEIYLLNHGLSISKWSMEGCMLTWETLG